MTESPLLMAVDDDPSVYLAFINHLRERARSGIPVMAMSTPAVLERYGDQHQVAETLLKPVTQASLAHVLAEYRPAH